MKGPEKTLMITIIDHRMFLIASKSDFQHVGHFFSLSWPRSGIEIRRAGFVVDCRYTTNSCFHSNSFLSNKILPPACSFRVHQLILSFSSTIAEGQCRKASIKAKACRSIWGSLLNTYPHSLLCKRYEAIGGFFDIKRFEKDYMIDGNSVRYVHSDLLEKVGMKVGRCSFCL